MEFEWTINEQDCIVNVIHYRQELPMRITGSGWGDCDPPEPEEFEFELLHPDGTPWPELHEEVDQDDEINILQYYLDGADREPDYD